MIQSCNGLSLMTARFVLPDPLISEISVNPFSCLFNQTCHHEYLTSRQSGMFPKRSNTRDSSQHSDVNMLSGLTQVLTQVTQRPKY